MANPPPVLSRSRASSLSRSGSSNLHHSHSHSHPHPHSHRPTTPLRRISSSSLRALSLSHSASRRSHGGGVGAGRATDPGLAGAASGAAAGPGSSGGGGDAAFEALASTGEASLGHLAPVLAELADSVCDLTSNLDALEIMHARLDGINDAVAAWLLGLRANGYTVDFIDAPTRLNFELSLQKQHERAIRDEQERLDALLLLEQQAARQRQRPRQLSEDEDDDDDAAAGGGSDPRQRYGGAGAGDSTFVSGADASFVSNQGFHDAAPPTTMTRGRGGSRGASAGGVRGGRGAGGRGGARGGSMAGAGAAARKRKEEMATFADPILPLLPIDIREKRRAETEKVLWALRERPDGTTMQDLVASLATAGPAQTVPQVRINECLLALARAKVVVKAVVKGATTYRLDPNKCAV